MFPNPWNTSAPVVAKPAMNSYENISTQQQHLQQQQAYPFYTAPNALQNMAMTQQNSLTLNTTSIMTQSLQPNAIDPAMVQKWQEWKRWELWQQQFQQWQQQTGQLTAVSTQSVPPPMPPSQPLQPSQLPTIPFKNQQYPYSQSIPPLPVTVQPQQINPNNDVTMKRGLEPELQNNEKKLKIDTGNSKKEIELNDDTETKFEEQFKSWEEKFLNWKEQNKNHPDKTQYIEYEKKWLNWRDHLKQKCELLKKKKELKMAEKKKEAMQAEENKVQSQQRSGYNFMMTNVTASTNEPSILQHSHNTSSAMPSSFSENQIPGLDLANINENVTKGFPNMSRILPQNQNGPIQTPDDKPFNFPKNTTNPATINPNPVNTNLGNMNLPSTSMYQNSPSWSKYNNPVLYYNQKPPDVDNTSISRFGQQTDNSHMTYGGDTHSTPYNNSRNSPNMNFRRPVEGSYNNNPPNESNTLYNQPSGDQSYNRNFNMSSNNFRGYNQPNTNTSNFNKPTTEQSNIPYHQPKQSMNPLPSKPPSLLSLNVAKPILLDKPGNYPENKNVVPNRYERNWNIDEDEDPENEYMEAHKKFSSEPYDDQNEDDQFSSNNQNRNVYNENNHYSGGQGARSFNNDYSRPFNQSRGGGGQQMIRNTDNNYHRPNNQFSRNVGQNYPREMQTLKNNDCSYNKPQNNMRNTDMVFNKGAPFTKDADNDYFNEPDVEKNNFALQEDNYGPPSRGNFESRSSFGNNTKKKNDWVRDRDYTKNKGPSQQPVKDTVVPPPLIPKPYEAAPIDPVKIFDYRHLSTLKVIPGLSKETVVPVKIYDYKHGGKRILPWQDRGFSRRNANQPRDLNENEGFIQNNTIDLEQYSRKPLIEKPTFRSSDIIPSDERDQNPVKNETEKIESTVDTITIFDDEEKKENPQPDIETVDMCAPSPPKMSVIGEVKKSPERQLLTIETLLCPPGRLNRPSKIVIILRGLPGSGKSYVAKLIKDKEVKMGGQAPRILSLDEYFMTEVTKTEIDPETNKMVEKKVMEYEHDPANESLYRTSFIKAFKKKLLENYFSFYIIDAINNKVSYYKDILEISRVNGFTAYIVELESDVDLCIKRNIHNRTAHEINGILRSWVKTPADHILLDIRSLLHSPSKTEVETEDVSDIEMELDEETAVDDKSEENKNEFEEEKKNIERYLGPNAFKTHRWAYKIVLTDLKDV